MVDYSEWEILSFCFFNYEQKSTEKEEEIWGHLSPISRGCFTTGWGIQPHCRVCGTMYRIPQKWALTITVTEIMARKTSHHLLSSLLWLHMLPACWPLPSHLMHLSIHCQNQECRIIFNSILFRGNPISKITIKFLRFSEVLEKKGRPWFTFYLIILL